MKTVTTSHMKRTLKRAGALLAIAGLSLSVSACSSSANDAKTVTIMVTNSFALPDELINKFEQETGYDLVLTSVGEGEMALNQLILNKNNPTVDGVFGISSFKVATAVDEGVLEPYTSNSLPASAADYAFDEHVTPIDVGAVCVNADDAWFTEHNLPIPQDLDELAAPENAKLLVIENPLEDNTGFAFFAALASMKEEEGAISYLNSLLDNGTRVDPSWDDAYYTDFSAGEGKGEYPLVLSYSSSPAYTQGATSNIDGTCTQYIEYAGVVKGAKNPEGAKAFIDFLLSDEVQAAFPEAMYMYPVNSDIELPADWAQWATLPEPALSYDPEVVAAQSEHWLKAWTDLYEATGNR